MLKRISAARLFGGLALAIWLIAAGSGVVMLERFAAAEGAVAPLARDWPAKSPLPFERGRANLIVFAHPMCPCTRATLHELEALLSRSHSNVSVRVMLFAPSNPPPNWGRGPLWDLAAAIPGVIALPDPDGRAADCFAAKTSGWTVLYDATGTLRFAGGITAARGHEGDNDGADSIVAILNGQAAGAHRTPVFGCAMPAASRSATSATSALSATSDSRSGERQHP